MPLGRVRCISKSETFKSFTGYHLGVAACLGAWLVLPGLRGDLGAFAKELAGLNCPSFLRVRLLNSLPDLPFGKIDKNVNIMAKLSN